MATKPGTMLMSEDSAEEYSSGEEVETERERQQRLDKARAEIQQRIQKYKETKWKDKAPSLKLPASKVRMFAKNNQQTVAAAVEDKNSFDD